MRIIACLNRYRFCLRRLRGQRRRSAGRLSLPEHPDVPARRASPRDARDRVHAARRRTDQQPPPDVYHRPERL